MDITAVNGVPIAGHEGPGSIADITVRKLLTMQGVAKPERIVSQMSYPGSANAFTEPHATDIGVSFSPAGGSLAHSAGAFGSALSPDEWTQADRPSGRDSRPDGGQWAILGGHSRQARRPGRERGGSEWQRLAPPARRRPRPRPGARPTAAGPPLRAAAAPPGRVLALSALGLVVLIIAYLLFAGGGGANY